MAERNVQEGDWVDRERWKLWERKGIEGWHKLEDE
jgi:hypothetical protein